MNTELVWSDTTDGATLHADAFEALGGATTDTCTCGKLHPVIRLRVHGRWEGGARDVVDIIFPAGAAAQLLAWTITQAAHEAHTVHPTATRDDR